MTTTPLGLPRETTTHELPSPECAFAEGVRGIHDRVIGAIDNMGVPNT